jgi:hypothetical protein
MPSLWSVQACKSILQASNKGVTSQLPHQTLDPAIRSRVTMWCPKVALGRNCGAIRRPTNLKYEHGRERGWMRRAKESRWSSARRLQVKRTGTLKSRLRAVPALSLTFNTNTANLPSKSLARHSRHCDEVLFFAKNSSPLSRFEHQSSRCTMPERPLIWAALHQARASCQEEQVCNQMTTLHCLSSLEFEQDDNSQRGGPKLHTELNAEYLLVETINIMKRRNSDHPRLHIFHYERRLGPAKDDPLRTSYGRHCGEIYGRKAMQRDLLSIIHSHQPIFARTANALGADHTK